MIKSINDLKAIRDKNAAEMATRDYTREVKSSMGLYKYHILICGGTGCTSGKSKVIFDRFQEKLNAIGKKRLAQVVMTGCFGLCAKGPIVIVYPEGTFYCHVKPDDVEEIVNSHLIGGKKVDRLVYEENGELSSSLYDTKFYAKQHRVALRNCGVINPENIEEYIAKDGYTAIAKCLGEYEPQQVIDIIKESGLRGRGGAGFSTGLKWQLTKNAVNDIKYVCCNADEGDPGAFMDRSILEGDPHAVIEAMSIAAYAIGAKQGYVYIRAEYPIAVYRLRTAINQAREYGLLGKNILGTNFEFDMDIRLGAGAFVCGEETALMTSIEGQRGEPRPRPPFPANKGLFGKPTMLNNVETYANVPQIIINGPEWFSSMGTEKSKGTKVFALGGKIVNTGLVEVSMGTTLREIVEDIGGGIPGGKKFKAAQTGGPSGGCIPASLIDTPIDYDNLIKIGSMMGSGGLIVMDETTCMVDIAKFFLEFTVEESCGKCTPCRIGTKRLLELLEKVTNGTAVIEDIDRMEELCHYIKQNALCGLGQTAPNPVLSTLRYFRDEYVSHIVDKTCPAGVCKKLVKFRITDDCRGCSLCSRKCPVGAISGQIKEKFIIDLTKCIKCGACIESCKFNAIVKE